jgi:hypothetical protein
MGGGPIGEGGGDFLGEEDFLNILGLETSGVEPFSLIAFTDTSYFPSASFEVKSSKTGDVVVKVMLFFPMRGLNTHTNFFQSPLGTTTSILEEDNLSWSAALGFGAVD